MNCKKVVCSKISHSEFKEYCEKCQEENKITKDYVIESFARYVLLAMWLVLYITFMNFIKIRIGFTAFNVVIYIACSIAYLRLINLVSSFLFPLHKKQKSIRRVLRIFKVMRLNNILQIQDMLKGQEEVEIEYMSKKRIVIRYLDTKNCRKLIVDDCPMFIRTSIKNGKIDFSWIDTILTET